MAFGRTAQSDPRSGTGRALDGGSFKFATPLSLTLSAGTNWNLKQQQPSPGFVGARSLARPVLNLPHTELERGRARGDDDRLEHAHRSQVRSEGKKGAARQRDPPALEATAVGAMDAWL